MLVALVSGAFAGLALFALQHFTVTPLIETAEIYEPGATTTKPRSAPPSPR
jgi:predicted cobalt transporter CbtA